MPTAKDLRVIGLMVSTLISFAMSLMKCGTSMFVSLIPGASAADLASTLKDFRR